MGTIKKVGEKSYNQDANGDWYEVESPVQKEPENAKVLNGVTYYKDDAGNWYEGGKVSQKKNDGRPPSKNGGQEPKPTGKAPSPSQLPSQFQEDKSKTKEQIAREDFESSMPFLTEKIKINQPGDIMTGQQRNQMAASKVKADKIENYRTQVLPQKVKEEKEKVKQASLKPELGEQFNPVDFATSDIATYSGGASLNLDPKAPSKDKFNQLNQFFGNDASNVAPYFDNRVKAVDTQIAQIKQNPMLWRSLNQGKSDLAEIEKLKDYKLKLAAASNKLATDYTAWLYPDASLEEKGEIKRKLAGDGSVNQELAFKEKGIPLTDEQKFNNAKQGIDVERTRLENDYRDVPPDQRDDAYYQRLAMVNNMDETLLNQFPDYKKSQVGMMVAQLASQDPNIDASSLIGFIPQDLDQKTIDYISEKYKIPKEDLKGLQYGDIPDESILSNVRKGALGLTAGFVTGATRILGSALGVDSDRLTYVNNKIAGLPDYIAGNNPYQKTAHPQSIIDINPTSSTYLQNIPNPKAGKSNYNLTTVSHSIATGAAEFAAFMTGLELTTLAVKGGAKLAGMALTAEAAQSAAMTTYMVVHNYENNWQRGNEVLGEDASEVGKAMYATLSGYIDKLAFDVLPKDKLFLSNQAKAVMNKELSPLLKDLTIKNINKEVIQTKVQKVVQGLINTSKEVGHITAAMDAAAISKAVVNSVVGKDEPKKYFEEAWHEVKQNTVEIPLTMGLPLGVMEVVKAKQHSSFFKENVYSAGLEPNKYIALIQQELGKGNLTPEEANSRMEVVKTMHNIVQSTPDINPLTNKPFTHNQQVEYAYNRLKESGLRAKALAHAEDPAISYIYLRDAQDLADVRKAMLKSFSNPPKQAEAPKEKTIPQQKVDIERQRQDELEKTPEDADKINAKYDAEITKLSEQEELPSEKTIEEIIPKEQLDKTQSIMDRVANNENINEGEIKEAEDILYTALADNPKLANLIEPLILKLQNHENVTKTETVQTTERKPIEGTLAAKRKVEIKPALEQSEGSTARVVLADGTTGEGTLRIVDGNYVIEVEGQEPIVVGEKAITDRDLKVPEGESPVELDENGNVKSATFETKDGHKVTITDPEKALDLGIQLSLETVGEIPDEAFDRVYEDVIKEDKIEVPVEKPKVEKKVETEAEVPEQKEETVSPEEADIEKRRQEDLDKLGKDKDKNLEQANAEPDTIPIGQKTSIRENAIKTANDLHEYGVKRINDKYDAELKALKEKQKSETPQQKEIERLRAEEQAEYDAMPDPKDEAKRKEIYDKYDKLISPLLKEGEPKVEVPKQKKKQPKGKAAKFVAENLAEPAGEGEGTPKPEPPTKEKTGEEILKELEDKGTKSSDEESLKELADKNKGNKVKRKIIEQARKAIKTLKSIFPNMDIHLHENEQEYNDVMEKVKGKQSSGGNFAYTKNADGTYSARIDINLNAATSTTVAHEVTHAILFKAFGENQEVFQSFRDKISKVLGSATEKGLKDFADSPFYKAQGVTAEEYLSELSGLLSSKTINPLTLSKIASAINEFVFKVTGGKFIPFENVNDAKDVIEFFDNVSKAIKKGNDLTNIGKEKIVETAEQKIKSKSQEGDELDVKEEDYKKAKKIVNDNKKEFINKYPESVTPEPQLDKNGNPKLIVTEGAAKGERKVEVLYKNVPYSLENGALKYISKIREKATDKLADKLVEDYNLNKDKPEISAAIGWYGNMRKWFQKNFGANIEMFGQLLAATSARTEVVDNFKQAVDAMRNLAKGKYDDLLKDYDKHVKSIKSLSVEELRTKWQESNPTKRPSEFNADNYRRYLINKYEDVPLRSNGKKFNANSKKVLQALHGNWIEQTEGPKTKNFAGNLTGRSFDATIDVWAARYLRRKIFEGNTSKWRILPQSEGSVQFGKLKSGEMTGDYPFAEEVMRKASEKLGIKADDLQAFLWYLEKDVWDKNNWTNITGKKKASFEEAATSISSDRYQVAVTTFRDEKTFDPAKFEEERKSIEKEISDIPGIIASRVSPSEGEFVSPTEVFTEPTFDIEFTVSKNTDIANVIKRVNEIQDKYSQDATIISKFVDANHPNARPIIEVGLASPTEKSEIIEDIKKTLSDLDVRGFTIARDRQGKILGLRAQFVPEFETGVTIDEGVTRFVKGFEAIKEKYGENKDISYLSTDFVDSQVKQKENEAKQNEQNGGTSTSEQGVQRELSESETRRQQDVGNISEEPGRQSEGQRDRTDDGLVIKSEIPPTGLTSRSQMPMDKKVSDMKDILKEYVDEGKSLDEIKDILKDEFGDYYDDVKGIIDQAHQEMTTTGIKNAVTERERGERGLEEIEVEAKRSFGKVFDDAKQMIANGVANGLTLAAEIIKNPRPLKAEESAVLLIDRMRISNEYNKKNAELIEAQENGETSKADIIQSQMEALEEEMDLNDEAARKSGYEQGLGLAARRMLIAQDYSLVTQMNRLKAANGGKEVPKQYQEQLKSLITQLEEANNKLDKLEKTQAGTEKQTGLSKVAKVSRTPEQFEKEKQSIKSKIATKWGQTLTRMKSVIKGRSQIVSKSAVTPQKQAQLESIVKDVNDMVKLYAESGITDLKKIIDNVHQDLSNSISGIDRVDVEDIVLGKYDTQKPKTPLTPAKIQAQANVRKVKTQIDMLKEELKNKQRSGVEKAVDYLHGWHRFSILSGIPSVGKIGMAAATRGVVTRAENIVGQALSLIPGIRKIAKQAPRHGGISVSAEAKAFSNFFNKMTRQDVMETMKTGVSQIDYLYGKKEPMAGKVPEWMEFFGRMHSAIKLLPKRAEFFRSLEMRTEHALRNGKDINDPAVQQEMATAAYNDALRAIFMQDNIVTDAYSNVVKKLGDKYPALASALKFALPIVKVPTNYVAEAAEYMPIISGLNALSTLIRGRKGMTEEQSDFFMRQMKKGAIGSAIMFLGFMNPQAIGGYYTGKRKKDELEAGEIELFGVKLPHFMLHTPLLEMLQIGATMRRAQEAKLAKGEEPSKFDGIPAAFKGLGQQVPFIGTGERISRALEKEEPRNEYLYSLGKSLLEPQLMQNLADWTDMQEGKVVKRKTETFGESLKEGFPKLRSTLKEEKTKFTDKEYEEFSNITEKGLNIPELNKRTTYKVKIDTEHPDGHMTEEEYDKFIPLQKEYVKDAYKKFYGSHKSDFDKLQKMIDAVPETSEEKAKMNSLKDAIQNKIDAVHNEAIKAAKRKVGLTQK